MFGIGKYRVHVGEVLKSYKPKILGQILLLGVFTESGCALLASGGYCKLETISLPLSLVFTRIIDKAALQLMVCFLLEAM